MITRYVLQRRDGTETTLVPLNPNVELPAVGDAIAVSPGEEGAGCYWVSHREWSVVNRTVQEVRVIAAESAGDGTGSVTTRA